MIKAIIKWLTPKQQPEYSVQIGRLEAALVEAYVIRTKIAALPQSNPKVFILAMQNFAVIEKAEKLLAKLKEA